MFISRLSLQRFGKPVRFFSSAPLELLTRDFLQALESRKSWETVKQFYHPDVLQTEFPSEITKVATVRSLPDLELAAEKGSKVIKKERYDIKNIHSVGKTVILEAIWRGTLAIPLGKLKVGDDIIADFAQFYEYAEDPADGKMKIIRQRNYDCFQSFM